MKKILACFCALGLTGPLIAQTGSTRNQQGLPDDVVRITTQLVQTDVVVMDKNDQTIPNLGLSDFEVFENGKRQELQAVEFINTESPDRRNNSENSRKLKSGIETASSEELSARNIRRVMAFVVDDVTIPAVDMARVRGLLNDFVDHKMQDGDLVAIVRTVGGQGLLEQFTSDRQILRRAIMQLGVRSIPPYLATGGETERIAPPSPLADSTATETVSSNNELDGPSEGTNQIPRAMLALSVGKYLIESMRQIPGRKNLILLSGGLPLFDLSRGSVISDVSQLFRTVADDATRSGVVIDTMDVRGLTTSGVAARFQDTPGRSALGGGTFAGDDTSSVGRGFDPKLLGERNLTEELTLRDLSGRTGGVSVANTNNFAYGLDKILSRSRGYYRLAYRPSEPFDSKFHRVTIKVKQDGLRTFAAEGYYAREDKSAAGPLAKEQEIRKAAISPLAKRDLELKAELLYRFLPNNQVHLEINTFINARQLQFTRSDDARYHSSFDMVGFVFDQAGRNRGGITQTVSADLSEQEYRQAIDSGLSHTASTQAPPGYYQLRLAVREVATGKVGTVSRYFEVPDLSKKQLMMSSIILYQVNHSGDDNTPEQLGPTRVISRKHDLRYAVIVYNPKLESGKPLAKSQLQISLGGKILFKEPEQKIQTPARDQGQFIKVGQIGLSKVNPGRYVLTLVVSDPLADKKRQIVSRSVDFTVVD